MFIEKIEITNLGVFKNKTSLDLKPNPNKIKTDLESNFFIKRNNNYMSTINAIGGKNSSGKSTFIKSMYILKRYFNDISSRAALDEYFNDQFKKRQENKTKKTDLSAMKILSKMLKQMQSYGEFIENNKGIKKDSKLILDYKKEVIKKWYLQNASSDDAIINNKPIVISLKIITKSSNIIFTYNMFSNKEEHFFTNEEGQIIKETNKICIKVKKILKNLFVLDWHVAQIANMNEEVNKLLKVFGEENLLSIVKMTDENIIKIKTNNSKFEKFILKDREITIENLSGGTKRFILLFSHFIKAFEKKEDDAWIFIDEIETGLHQSLVDFFKKMIRQQADYMDIQLFFTSHNTETLSENQSFKQVFLILKDVSTGETRFEKSSTRLKPQNSFIKKYHEEEIGSHPFQTDIDNVLDIIYERYDKNE